MWLIFNWYAFFNHIIYWSNQLYIHMTTLPSTTVITNFKNPTLFNGLNKLQVLLDIFKGDPRLWNAYSQTLRVMFHSMLNYCKISLHSTCFQVVLTATYWILGFWRSAAFNWSISWTPIMTVTMIRVLILLWGVWASPCNLYLITMVYG